LHFFGGEVVGYACVDRAFASGDGGLDADYWDGRWFGWKICSSRADVGELQELLMSMDIVGEELSVLALFPLCRFWGKEVVEGVGMRGRRRKATNFASALTSLQSSAISSTSLTNV
jgi:hypothetical protein